MMDLSSEKLKVHNRWLEPKYHKGQLQHTKVVLKVRPNSTSSWLKRWGLFESSNDYFDHISNRGEISTHSTTTRIGHLKHGQIQVAQ